MTLPNVLGIGAQRSGTTWLDFQLRSHPDIYLPTQRKEVHFFNDYYDRGVDWYQGFFPPRDEASQYRIIGEITPGYLYHKDVPPRIRKHIPDCRFVAILRNPVERAYSQYARAIRVNYDRRSFRDFLDQQLDVYSRGFYSEQLKRYLEYFPMRNFLILIFEHTINDPARAQRRLADFLSVDASCFGYNNDGQKVNSSYQVRFKHSYATAHSIARYLRKKDVDWVVNMAKGIGADRWFGKGQGPLPMDKEIRTQLLSKYEADIAALEDMLGQDLSLWRVS
jgi:hypothetical protein